MNVEKPRLLKSKMLKNQRFLAPRKVVSRIPLGFSNFPLGNRKALSPLIATVLLVVFALVIGTITMNWGRSYVEKIKEEPKLEGAFDSAVIISIKDIDTPLKELQLQHIVGKITKEEYIEKEKSLLND